MRNLLRTISEKLSAGEDLALVTVVAASGATPQGAGARMLVGKTGRVYGTIGGGGVEFRSEQIAGQVLEERVSRGQNFTFTQNDAQNLGMICGGKCEVFFHFLPAGDEKILKLCREAEEAFCNDRELWLVTDVAAGDAMGLYTREQGFLGMDPVENLTFDRHPARMGDLFVQKLTGSGKVYIFGGGHVAQELVPVLAHVGFRCVVLEDREAFADATLFPGAERVICGDMEHLENYITVTREDYVCVMTRGHAQDTVILAQVLPCRPAYCGAIGSAAKAAGIRKQLQERWSMGEELLNQITSPIGLPIKGKTPAEIAISIAAQMILCRAEKNGR